MAANENQEIEEALTRQNSVKLTRAQSNALIENDKKIPGLNDELTRKITEEKVILKASEDIDNWIDDIGSEFESNPFNEPVAGPNIPANGPNRHANGPNRHANGPNRHANGPNRHANGPNRHANGPNRQANGPNRQANGPNRQANGPNRQAAAAGPNRNSNEHTNGYSNNNYITSNSNENLSDPLKPTKIYYLLAHGQISKHHRPFKNNNVKHLIDPGYVLATRFVRRADGNLKFPILHGLCNKRISTTKEIYQDIRMCSLKCSNKMDGVYLCQDEFAVKCFHFSPDAEGIFPVYNLSDIIYAIEKYHRTTYPDENYKIGVISCTSIQGTPTEEKKTRDYRVLKNDQNVEITHSETFYLVLDRSTTLPFLSKKETRNHISQTEKRKKDKKREKRKKSKKMKISRNHSLEE